MPSSHTGHFVQIWRPIGPRDGRRWINVEGRVWATTVSRENFEWNEWTNTSRELTLKRATHYAKAYRQAGFRSRVLFRGHGIRRVIREYTPKKSQK